MVIRLLCRVWAEDSRAGKFTQKAWTNGSGFCILSGKLRKRTKVRFRHWGLRRLSGAALLLQ
jgi:hypothetical protein